MIDIEDLIKHINIKGRTISLEYIVNLNLDENDLFNLMKSLEAKNIIIDYNVELDKNDKFEFDLIELYLNDIGRYPLLTRDEEQFLLKKVKLGDKEAKEKLIISNLKLVVSVASSYMKQNQRCKLDFLDLIQEGNFGLIRAIEIFDINSNNKLSSYAVPAIYNSIIRGVFKTDRNIKIPIPIREKINKLYSYIYRYESIHGKKPTIKDINKDLNLGEEEVMSLVNLSRDTLSLFSPINHNCENKEGPACLMDFIPNDTDMENDIISKIDDKLYLENLKNIISERDYKILMYRKAGLTLSEIGIKFNLSRERVRQLLKKIKKILCENNENELNGKSKVKN